MNDGDEPLEESEVEREQANLLRHFQVRADRGQFRRFTEYFNIQKS